MMQSNGIFCGISKPHDLNEFFANFVDECQQLAHNGIRIGDHNFCVELHSFVCDAPARAMIKNVKPHGGYYACDKCTQEWDKPHKPFAVVVFLSSVEDVDYKTAREKAKDAEGSSSLDTAANEKARSRVKQKRHLADLEEADDLDFPDVAATPINRPSKKTNNTEKSSFLGSTPRPVPIVPESLPSSNYQPKSRQSKKLGSVERACGINSTLAPMSVATKVRLEAADLNQDADGNIHSPANTIIRSKSQFIHPLLGRQPSGSHYINRVYHGVSTPVTVIPESHYLTPNVNQDANEEDDDDTHSSYRVFGGGGKDVGTTTRKIMRTLLTNSLARCFNFVGHGAKHAFSPLQLREVMNDAVRRNPQSKNATDSDVEEVIKDWLRTAFSRRCVKSGSKSSHVITESVNCRKIRLRVVEQIDESD